MTEQWQTNGVHRELEHRAAEVRANLGRKEAPIRPRDSALVETDGPDEPLGVRTATLPHQSLIIAAATFFAAGALLALRWRGRRRPSLFGRWTSTREKGTPEKGLLVQGLEKAALSLVALAVQRLGTRGLDHLLASEASLPEATSPRRGADASERSE